MMMKIREIKFVNVKFSPRIWLSEKTNLQRKVLHLEITLKNQLKYLKKKTKKKQHKTKKTNRQEKCKRKKKKI